MANQVPRWPNVSCVSAVVCRSTATTAVRLHGFFLLLIAAAIILPRPAAAQCGPTITGHFGGETTAVAQVNASTLMVARGTEVEMFSLANPSAPAPFSPRRRAGLDAPAVKISMTQGASRAFVLLANGDVKVLTVAGSSFVETGLQSTISSDYAVDIVADGQRVYIAVLDENTFVPEVSFSIIQSYDASSGVPLFVWTTDPLTEDFGYDRLAIVNNILWAGFHEYQSVILGVEGFNLSNPASPARTGAALTNGPLGAYTARISAMTAVGGNKLLVSYRHGVSNSEDWLRAVNIAVPSNPAWNPAFDLNGYAGTMSSVGNQLRISIQDSGIGTWDTTNPAALVWLGAYFDQFPKIGQMVSVPSTDYWAAGPAGLMTMNTANPANPTLRSAPIVPLPTSPSVVRQRGNTTVVLDYTLNALRLFDYTLPEAQQLRSSLQLPFYSELVEIGELAGGVGLACVASKGNPAGDVIAIIDITNPAAPVLRSTIPGFRTHLLSVSGSRLYAFTTNSEFRIYELAQPLSPQLRSTTPFGGTYSNYTCMASWSNNAAALGTSTFGLWLIDTTNATAPLVSAVWNPVSGYRVNSMAKTPNYLYTSASVISGGLTLDNRLEVLVVSNIANPTQRFAVSTTTGSGNPGAFTSLTYVPNAVSNFLVGVRGKAHVPGQTHDDTQFNSLTIFQLASFFFTENIPTPIATLTIPLGHGNVAVNAGGSRILVAGDAAGLYQIAMPTSWAPGFGVRPFSQRGCYGGALSLPALAFANPLPVTFQWYRDGVALTDGPTPWGSTISGSTTFSLDFTNLREEDALGGPTGQHRYTCVASNSCGGTTSPPAALSVCYANCDCSTTEPLLNVSDFVCFQTKYAAGDPAANCDGSTIPPILNVSDFICFQQKYAAGCP
jgi:hypothetical protein